VYEGWLSVGYLIDKNIEINGTSYPIEAISYYDALNNFDYDSLNNELKFAMPFDWNLDRLKEVSVYVHEEITIPNPSPLAGNAYTGTLNNIDLSPKSIMVDRTNSSKDIVHIMLTKPNILDIAQKIVQNDDGTSISKNNQNVKNQMAFTLSPSRNAANISSMMDSNSMNMSMNGGGSM
jgi:hypothetical protein